MYHAHEDEEDPARCRRDKRCRLAYRDGGNIRLGEEGVRRLRRLVEDALDVRKW